MKYITCLCLVLSLLLLGCASTDETGVTNERGTVESSVLQFTTPNEDAVLVYLETSEGTITAVLYPELAPMACENFLGLAQAGYYDETLFHRAKEGFVIQGGDAEGTGLGGTSIWNHAFPNEITPSLHHYAGALCMAGANDAQGSLLSQFYIVASPPANLDEAALTTLTTAGYPQEVVDTYQQAGGLPYLDYRDTVFGQVISGMDVVDRIAQVDTDDNDTPKKDITLHSVSVA